MNLNVSHTNKSNTEVSMSNNTKQHGESDSKTIATNLIVNYLPDTMSQEDVKSLFGSVGELESCKLIRDKNTGQSLGYAFVNYKNPLSAQRAIDRLNGLGLQNKIIKVSYARPSCETIKGANLYVSGLPQSMTVQELNAIFSPNGTIIASRILMDSSTGLSKGVGFVRFDLRSQAEQAIKQLHGTIPKGCSEAIKVKFAGHPIARPPMPFVPPFFAAKSPFFQNPIRALAPRFFGLVQPPHRSLNCFRGCSLFVNNLSPDTDDQFLWQLFGPFGAVQNVRVVRDSKTQKCQGFGFVTMTHYEDALLAVSHLNGLYIGNRDKPLHVSF